MLTDGGCCNVLIKRRGRAFVDTRVRKNCHRCKPQGGGVNLPKTQIRTQPKKQHRTKLREH